MKFGMKVQHIMTQMVLQNEMVNSSKTVVINLNLKSFLKKLEIVPKSQWVVLLKIYSKLKDNYEKKHPFQ